MARRIADFGHAVAAGNAAAYFASEPQFQWYWSTLLSRSTMLRNDSFQRRRRELLFRPQELATRAPRPLVVQVIRIALRR
jgi:hypothetical protein